MTLSIISLLIGIWSAIDGARFRYNDRKDKRAAAKFEVDGYLNTLRISFFPKKPNEAYQWLRTYFTFLYEWKETRKYLSPEANALRKEVAEKSIAWINKIEEFNSGVQYFDEHIRNQIHIRSLTNEIPNSGDTTKDLERYKAKWSWSEIPCFLKTWGYRLHFGYGTVNKLTIDDIKRNIEELFKLQSESEIMRKEVLRLTERLLGQMTNDVSLSPIIITLKKWKQHLDDVYGCNLI